MPLLTQPQAEAVGLALGYGNLPGADFNNDLAPLVQTVFTTTAISAILDTLAQLEQIDNKLTEATSNSMAVDVGELKLNFKVHVVHLRSEGSRLIKRLSNVVGVSVHFDPYKQSRIYSVVA